MKKGYLLLLLAIACFVGKATAQLMQPCMADEMSKRLAAMDPRVIQGMENYYQKQINAAMKKIDLNKAARTTQVDESGNLSFWYDVPVVVHIIHDYNESSGGEYLSDNFIFNALNDWNTVYALQNPDTEYVISPFKKFIGNPHIRLHLANIDPNGNPTHGITRHRSYLTYIGGDQSKLDDWAPASYVNIWSVNQMDAANGFAAAYAYWPSEVANIPFWDGVICLSGYVDHGGATDPNTGNSYKTINHEVGHVFNLLHPWGPTNVPYPVAVTRGDPPTPCGDDGVDDTPPTKGHYICNCAAKSWPYPYIGTPLDSAEDGIYDTACSENYYKLYTNVSGEDSLVNYPDTANVQNIMDYSYCAKMFTLGQVSRMHEALNSNVAGRNNLWDMANLVNTGVMDTGGNFIPRADLLPILEFGATTTVNGGFPLPTTYMNNVNYFTFPNTVVKFHNESWNDTLTSLSWAFTGGATTPVSTSTTTFTNSFTQSGWVDLKMTGAGNNTGAVTTEWPNAIFVAPATGVNAATYIQNWQPGDDYMNWPYFNYYNNEFHWQLDSTVGYDDHYCMKYTGFDSRLDPVNNLYPFTGNPVGDFDDLFSAPADLSSFIDDTCNLNFYYAAASRSSVSTDITDTLDVDYTFDKGATWINLAELTKASLVNRGALATEFTPSGPSDWSPQSIGIPKTARTSYTTFRFRYRPNVGGDGFSSGNDFYMDRINFSNVPAYASNVKLIGSDVAVVPNPTNGDAYVIVKGADNAAVQINVTDVTGKTVYTASKQVTGNEARVLIPHTAIAVQGVYLIQTITGNQSLTKKLVVY